MHDYYTIFSVMFFFAMTVYCIWSVNATIKEQIEKDNIMKKALVEYERGNYYIAKYYESVAGYDIIRFLD